MRWKILGMLAVALLTGPLSAHAVSIVISQIYGGCTDINNNSADFTTQAPAPRNSASTFHRCSPVPEPGTLAHPGHGLGDPATLHRRTRGSNS